MAIRLRLFGVILRCFFRRVFAAVSSEVFWGSPCKDVFAGVIEDVFVVVLVDVFGVSLQGVLMLLGMSLVSWEMSFGSVF